MPDPRGAGAAAGESDLLAAIEELEEKVRRQAREIESPKDENALLHRNLESPYK